MAARVALVVALSGVVMSQARSPLSHPMACPVNVLSSPAMKLQENHQRSSGADAPVVSQPGTPHREVAPLR